MKILLPKQHGAWAMLLIPFLLGMIAGNPTFLHLSLFLGWLFLYLATYPLLMIAKKKKMTPFYKKWTIIYTMIALPFLLICLCNEWTLVYFGFAMLPFFLINIYFAKHNKERTFINDITAILEFGIGGLASYYVGSGSLDLGAWMIFIYTFLFFLGSTLYIKSMIREKKNTEFKYYSWGYHLLLLLSVALISWIAALAYLPSAFRAWMFYGKKISVITIGILEIVNAMVFFIVMLFLI